MGNLGWSELLVIGIVALIVVGPKDLPMMFQTLGRIMAKVRALGREFTKAMDDAAKETGVKDVVSDLNKIGAPTSVGLGKVQEAAKKFESWDPLKAKPKAKEPADKNPGAEAPAQDAAAKREKLEKAAATKAAARAAEAASAPADLPTPEPKA